RPGEEAAQGRQLGQLLRPLDGRQPRPLRRLRPDRTGPLQAEVEVTHRRASMLRRVPARAFPLALACLALAGAGLAAEEKTSFYKGKVVRPTEAMKKKLGRQADLALACADGKLYPLIEDAGSRMLFKDAALRDRPLRLSARLVKGRLQVVGVQSYI